MKKEMDTIQFETRYEVQAIAMALIDYVKDHPNKGQVKTVKELIALLDVMDMEW